jgi:hypothetical protein
VPFYARERAYVNEYGPFFLFEQPSLLAQEALKGALGKYKAPTKDETDALIFPFRARHELVKTHAWAIPTEDAIDTIVKHSPEGVVEIGAGTGYWARLISARGIPVAAFDQDPHHNAQAEGEWFEVFEGGPEKATDFPERSLFLCWPPYDTDMAYESVLAYDGDTLLYVGEGPGGCCGNDVFHDLLQGEWTELEEEYVALPQWPGIHDHLEVWSRKPRRR